MQTAEIVRRLLSRPVTPERALRMLHLLDTPSQLTEVIGQLGEESLARTVLEENLTKQVVGSHFARRPR